MFDLTGKTALVTGASRGLGKGSALALAKAGANVIVNYVSSASAAEDVVNEITAMGRKSIAIRADVGNEEDVKAMFEKAEAEFGGVDILVCNAGVNSNKVIEEISLEEWNRVVGCDLTGTFLCSKYALPYMKEKKKGRIIVISSVVAEQGGYFGQVHYAAAKAGQLGFARTLARNVAPYGITVNAITPGVHVTELVGDILGDTESPRIQKIINTLPHGKLGTAEDIAYATVYLASDEAEYLIGVTLDVNGGLYIR